MTGDDERTRGANLGAADTACAACPFRLENHGRRTGDGWYTKANRRRLWSGLRTGDAPGMTCHPTDPANPAPKRRPCARAADGADFRECTGWHHVAQVELRLFEQAAEAHPGDFAAAWRAYRASSQHPMTRAGLFAYATRTIPFPAGAGMPEAPDVTEHPGLALGL